MRALENRRDRLAGAAFVEAIVVAPFLGALLASVVALNAMYGAKLEAKSRARRLAWLQADSGECPPVSCTSTACREATAELGRGIDAVATTSHDGMSLRSIAGNVAGLLLGKVTRAVANADAALPPSIGQGSTTQQGVTTLLCNTTVRATESGRSALAHACATGLRETEYAGEVCR